MPFLLLAAGIAPNMCTLQVTSQLNEIKSLNILIQLKVGDAEALLSDENQCSRMAQEMYDNRVYTE